MRLRSTAIFCILCFPLLAAAQQTSGVQAKKQGNTESMPGMDMGQMPGMNMNPTSPMNMRPETFVQEILAHNTSGTSAEPNSTPVPMLMKQAHGWLFMFHANVFLVDQQQSGPRGADKFF